MEDKFKYSTSQLFNFAQDSYLERTSRPIYAIVFLLPFIVFYELGTILINTDVLRHYWQGRVVAFSWLQKFLAWVGFGSKFAWVATPLAVVMILIALQIASRKQWRFWFGDIWRMAVECILLAIPLIVLVWFINTLGAAQGNISRFNGHSIQMPLCEVCYVARVQSEVVSSCSAVTADSSSAVVDEGGVEGKWQYWMADIVTSIGAGIYEELIFRLILICVLMILFQNVLQFGRKNSIILAVLISAALFSAHHHIDFLTGQLNLRDQFNLAKFSFRTIAGVYFAVLFAIRGFGIAAGTHAFYDIIATVMNAAFFQQ